MRYCVKIVPSKFMDEFPDISTYTRMVKDRPFQLLLTFSHKKKIPFVLFFNYLNHSFYGIDQLIQSVDLQNVPRCKAN